MVGDSSCDDGAAGAGGLALARVERVPEDAAAAVAAASLDDAAAVCELAAAAAAEVACDLRGEVIRRTRSAERRSANFKSECTDVPQLGCGRLKTSRGGGVELPLTHPG